MQRINLLVMHVYHRDGFLSAPAAAGQMCERNKHLLVQT